MNQQQIEQANVILRQLVAYNLAEKLAQHFAGQDLNTTCIGHVPVGEFLNLSERAIAQLMAEFENPTAHLLPANYQWHSNHRGNENRTLVSVLQNFHNGLNSRNWHDALIWLEILVGYEMACGFWNHGTRSLHTVPRLRQKQLFSDLELKSAQLSEMLSRATTTHNALANELTARRAETQEIAKLTSKADENTKQTGTLLNQASSSEGKLQQILSNQEANLEKSKVELHALAQQVAALGQSIKEATDHLTKSKEMLVFMQEKEAFVNEIAGKSGAGLLGGQFKDRRDELKATSQRWLWGFVVAFAASAVWLFVAYKYLRVTGDDMWLVIVSNFGLLLPAAFVLGFVARQYSKERHFQEEYAFRSAVAMTLNSFADRLKGTPENGERLISETVEKLYKMPTMLQEKEASPGFLQTRFATDTIKATTELVKEVKKTE